MADEADGPADAGSDRPVRDGGRLLGSEREERGHETVVEAQELPLTAAGDVDDLARRSCRDGLFRVHGRERPAEGKRPEKDEPSHEDTSSRTPEMDRHVSPRSPVPLRDPCRLSIVAGK